MARPAPRDLSVTSVTDLTPNMRRITFGGDALADFPSDQDGAYVKLFLRSADGAEEGVRTYTVRRQHTAPPALDVDFVLHGDNGLASAWANRVKPGDSLKVGGPGARSEIAPDADWFFLVGDMTALPALSVNLESLPPDARGHAVVEIIDEADRQSLSAPAGIQIHWVLNPHPGASGPLIDAVRQRDWLEGSPAVWCACEFESMRALRRYFRKEKSVEKAKSYLSSYWKLGVAEEEHKKIKKVDNDTTID